LDRFFAIGHVSFQTADGYRLIEGSSAAFGFTWMEADSGARGCQGIVFSMQMEGFRDPAFGDEGNITWNVDACGACVLAGASHEFWTDTGDAVMVYDMGDVFIAKVSEGREQGIGCALAQAAEGCVANALPEFFQVINVGKLSFSFTDAGHNFEHTFGARATGSALAAGFFLNEFEEESGDIDHATVFVHDDQPPGAHDGAKILEGFVVNGHF